MVSIFNIPIDLSNTVFGTKKIKSKVPVGNMFAGVTNPLTESFFDKREIEALAMTNSRIRNLMEQYNLPLEANMEELELLAKFHLQDTKSVALKMYLALPRELKKDVNLQDLQDAATLHDLGKVLIPKSILNKRGKLSEKEFEIMKLHSEFGYEMLKNKGYNQNVLNLIKYHHQTASKKGYPIMEKDMKYSITLEILNVADRYTALREQRCYKNPLGKYEAIEIIAKDVNKGEISQEVYTALIKSV